MFKRIICALLALALALVGAVAEDAAFDADYYESDGGEELFGYPTLQLGDRDDDDSYVYVVFMQNRLIELGYLKDSADGVFGENTQTAVKAFQKYNGLEMTGIADATTQEKLFSDLSQLVYAPADSTMYGSDTLRVQNMLALWGFMGTGVDGVFGKGTANAVQRFKKYMRQLDPQFGVTPTPAPTATPSPVDVFGDGAMPVVEDELIDPTMGYSYELNGDIDEDVLKYVDGEKEFSIYRSLVRNGDSGSEVMRVQTRLQHLKYLYSADGSFGDNTEIALMYFQRKNGLVETGIADEATQRTLFSRDAVAAEEYVFPYKVIVDVSEQVVYVNKWTGDGYNELVKKMTCTTGARATPTPLGTYQAVGRSGDEWYFFKQFNCYAKWGYIIVGGVLFHSITYDADKKPAMSEHSLGHRGSHGCVRLSVDNAKWIYDNCPNGTTVVIRE